MFIQDQINRRQKEFERLCKSHSVKFLYAFGSSTSDSFDQSRSDIDLLVEADEPDPVERGEKLLSLWDNFECFFNRKIDLLTNYSLKNPYLRRNVNASKVLIYDGSGEKAII